MSELQNQLRLTLESAEWFSTEPGMRQQLDNRRATLEKLKTIRAPQILIESQEELVAELENKLGEK